MFSDVEDNKSDNPKNNLTFRRCILSFFYIELREKSKYLLLET